MSRRGENIRKRKDGRWEGRYIKSYNSEGKAKYGSVYGKTYHEVKKKLAEANSSLQANLLPIAERNLTLCSVLYLWLENNRIKLKEQTHAKYQRLIDKHIVPCIGNTAIKSVNAVYLNRLLLLKSNGGRLDGKGGLSPSYVRTLAFIIKSAMSFAVKNGYCPPVNGEILLPTKKKQTLEVLTAAEQSTLESHILSNVSDYGIGVLLSLYAGLRIGEVCGLKWGDIDFENATLHVHQTVERIANLSAKTSENKTKLILDNVKTISSNRIIPIPSKLLSLLRSFRQSADMFILPGHSYAYTDPRTFQYFFRKYLKDCHMRYVNYHALRHTFATRCMEAGMDVKSLSEILGHSNVNITLNTYVHSSIDHKRKQMEAMLAICGQK